MAALKKGDFITITYTGKLEDGTIFDTNDAKIAKAMNVKDVHPITICLGQGQLLKGLDAALIGKEGTSHTITLDQEHAFGKKRTDLIQIVPMQQLKDQKINPQAGMQLNIDGKYGIVKSAASGRVVVDFNHPLAGKNVIYDVTVEKEVTDLKEQVEALLKTARIPFEDITVKDKDVVINVKEVYPQPLMDAIQKKVGETTQANNITFEKK